MLHTLADHLEVVWGALLAAAIVVLLTPAVGGMARLLGVVDRPEGRRLNRSTVPRLGGLALFFGIFVPSLAFLDLSGETRGLLLGAAVATTVGAVDDFRGLRWWEKLGGQVAAAAIPVGFGIWVHRFTFPIIGIHTLPDWIGMPLSVLWIVAIMNMVNFLDGLDGLAAGVSAISAFTFTLIALSLPRPEVQAAILSAIVLGARARVPAPQRLSRADLHGRLGRDAARFRACRDPAQGLLKTASIVTLFFPLLVLAVPIIDTSFVVAKRLKYRQPVYVADRTAPAPPLREHRLLAAARGRLHLAVVRERSPRPPSHFASSARTSTASGIRGGRSSSRCSGSFALAASVYMVYLLEIVKLANPMIRRREEQARAQAEAAQDRRSTKSAVFGCFKRSRVVTNLVCSAQMEPQSRPSLQYAEAGGVLVGVLFASVALGLLDRLVGGLSGNRNPDRRGDRDPALRLRGLLALPGRLLMRSGSARDATAGAGSSAARAGRIASSFSSPCRCS